MQRRSTKLSGCKHSPAAAHWRLAHTFSLPPPPDTSTGYHYPVLTYNAAPGLYRSRRLFTAGCHDGRLSAGPRTAAQSGETHRSMENCMHTVQTRACAWLPQTPDNQALLTPLVGLAL
ncbi:unnamed protein product [Boreogadus saida]